MHAPQPVFVHLVLGPAVSDLLERNSALEARDCRTEARVDAVPEPEPESDVTVDVEAVGILVLALVAVGRASEQEESSRRAIRTARD